jgi:branched-subunit amino acid transport protein AzlD
LFLITFVTSIPAYFFYVPVLDDPRYIVGAGADTRVSFGAFLELILIIANIGTAVVLYPIVRRQNEILALGYVSARIVECVFIAFGILSLLTVVTLRQEAAAAGADGASLVTAGESLVALHEWTRQLGPGFVVGIGNGLILGYLMYTSRLVPRGMAVLGLIGGPLIIVTGVGVLLGVLEEGGVWQVAVIPEFLWELLLGIWPIVRGFNPSALARLGYETQ